MGQVTIYLEKEVEERMRATAKAMNVPQSKWIADLIKEKVATEWPMDVCEAAGSWGDFPEVDEVRAGHGADQPRESL